MPRPDIKTIAAASEIIASIAVIVSLVFVVASLNQNTEALQSLNDNFLYELTDSRLSDITSGVPLAEIFAKVDANEPISPAEKIHYDSWMTREIDIWELAFTRHQDGLMPPTQWIAWEASFINGTIPYLPKEQWDEGASGYGAEFQEYMEGIYAKRL